MCLCRRCLSSPRFASQCLHTCVPAVAMAPSQRKKEVLGGTSVIERRAGSFAFTTLDVCKCRRSIRLSAADCQDFRPCPLRCLVTSEPCHSLPVCCKMVALKMTLCISTLFLVFLFFLSLHMLHSMIDKHFWMFVRQLAQTFFQTFFWITGVRAVNPLSSGWSAVYQHTTGGRRRREANVPEFYGNPGQDATTRCYQTFSLQMFNPRTIKWTNYTHG